MFSILLSQKRCQSLGSLNTSTVSICWSKNDASLSNVALGFARSAAKALQISTNVKCYRGAREKVWAANSVEGNINSSHASLGFLGLLQSFLCLTHVQWTGRVASARTLREERNSVVTEGFRSYLRKMDTK